MLTQKEQFALLFVGAAALFGGFAIYLSRADTSSPESLIAVEEVAPLLTDQAVAEPPAPRAELEPFTEEPVATLEPPVEREIAVAVMGAVERGGLFRVDPDMRVGEIIERAGGTTENADLSDINLGAKLIDGTTLAVPLLPAQPDSTNRLTNTTPQVYTPNPPQYTRSFSATQLPMLDSGVEPGKPQEPSAAGALINLNTATQSELETLPGIGPAFAQRIIDYRERTPFTSVDQLDEVPGIGPKRLAELRALVTVQ